MTYYAKRASLLEIDLQLPLQYALAFSYAFSKNDTLDKKDFWDREKVGGKEKYFGRWRVFKISFLIRLHISLKWKTKINVVADVMPVMGSELMLAIAKLIN